MLSVDHKKLFPLSITPDSDVIAAGPLTKQPGSTLYRIVLRHDGRQFIVHSQELRAVDLPAAGGKHLQNLSGTIEPARRGLVPGH